MKRQEVNEWIQTLVIAVTVALFIRYFIGDLTRVQMYSMEPTLSNGERLVLSKITYRFSAPRRGDIVVVRSPVDNRRLVKRLIAVGGDTVRIHAGKVYVNGAVLDEPYIKEPPREDFPETTVPPGTVFVLGDNRNNSLDSRSPLVGFIPRDMVEGKVLLVLLDRDQTGRIVGLWKKIY